MYTFTGDIQKETVNIKKLLVKQLLQFSQYVSWEDPNITALKVMLFGKRVQFWLDVHPDIINNSLGKGQLSN